MYIFSFTKNGEKEFLKLDNQDRERILKKLKFFKNEKNINHYFKHLTDMKPATHRLRIGAIRIILQKIDEENFYILDA